MSDKLPGLHSLAIHAGEAPDPETGALVPPLHLASIYYVGTVEDGAAIPLFIL